MFKETWTHWSADNAPRLGASLSYYASFSIAPLLLLTISIAGFIFGRAAVQGKIMEQLGKLMGTESVKAIESMIQAAQKPASGVVATLIGVVTLILGASGVMIELKDGLNKTWGIKKRSGFGVFIKDRLLSIAMVLAVGFLLLVSLALSAAIAALGGFLGGMVPLSELLLHVLNLFISFGAITLLFAAIFKSLPDAKIKWRDVWLGAALTSFLFAVGKFFLGLYIGRLIVGSSYGAAGSVLVMLLWIYYSAQILYFGAEFTKIYANHYGSGIHSTNGDIGEKLTY